MLFMVIERFRNRDPKAVILGDQLPRAASACSEPLQQLVVFVKNLAKCDPAPAVLKAALQALQTVLARQPPATKVLIQTKDGQVSFEFDPKRISLQKLVSAAERLGAAAPLGLTTAMARHALLIGVSEFADQRLARLNAPTNDVIALQGILQDGSRGNFDSVELSLNEDFLAIRDHLSSFFHDRAPDDVLLLYYSGDGILGRGNRLFLATSGSNLDTPNARSVSARDIRDFLEEGRAQRQIVVLDCCHSGAFAEHPKSAGVAPAVTPNTFSSGDAGLYVLTAADTLQFAWDGEELRDGDDAAGGHSLFTSWLVEGLEKGEAAPDDEQITMDALYGYLFRRARSAGAATPQRFVQGGVADLVISSNPLMGSSQIDPGILAALGAEEFRTRLGAVAELSLQMEEGYTVAARAARLILQRHLQYERDFQVRRAITRALDQEANRPSRAARQVEEENRQAEAARHKEEEKQRAEVVRVPEERQRADAARQAEEEQQRAEAARQAEPEQRCEEEVRSGLGEARSLSERPDVPMLQSGGGRWMRIAVVIASLITALFATLMAVRDFWLAAHL
jgi:hypothetical protein